MTYNVFSGTLNPAHLLTSMSFNSVSVADATFLGAPLFPSKVLGDTWLASCEDLKLAVDRLSLLNPQDALLLLRVISNITKLRLVKALVWPVMSYGCEAWTLNKARKKNTNF